MSEVKRYGHISYLVEATPQILMLYPSMTVYVLSSDYDAAKSELAALQEELSTTRAAAKEELDGVKYVRRKFRQERDELQQRLTAAEQRNAALRQEVATLHAINETPDENILWDVLNATVGIITRRAYPHALESEAHNAGAKVILDRRAGLAATHLKPTESGASE